MIKFLKTNNLSLSITLILSAFYAGIPFSFIWAKTTESPLVIGFLEPVLTSFFFIVFKPLFILLKTLRLNPGTISSNIPEPSTWGLFLTSTLSIMLFYLTGCSISSLINNIKLQQRISTVLFTLTIIYSAIFILTTTILSLQTASTIHCEKECAVPEQQAIQDCDKQCQTKFMESTQTPVNATTDVFNSCITQCIIQNEAFRACRVNCMAGK